MNIRNDSGFNLIEICICLAIMSIVSSGLYYGYGAQKHSLERKQAELTLQDIALNLEAHHDLENGYSDLKLKPLGFNETQNNYEYSLRTTQETFMIEARPTFHDTCGILALNQLNKQYANDPSCWH